MRNSLGTSEMSAVVKHLGAHMVLSVAIVIPIPGLRSLARFGWTLSLRLKGLFGLATGKITKENYRAVRSIHTVPVMFLALVPAVGAIAYAVSEPMLKGPGKILVDESASRLPFNLYRRLSLARFTAPPPAEGHQHLGRSSHTQHPGGPTRADTSVATFLIP